MNVSSPPFVNEKSIVEIVFFERKQLLERNVIDRWTSLSLFVVELCSPVACGWGVQVEGCELESWDE